MSMDRWDPFRDMMTVREAMDRWLQQSLSGTGQLTGQLLSTLRPDSIPIDLIEHEDAYEVRAAVPGVKPEDLEVTVQGERVIVRAEARADNEQRGDHWLMREHRIGTMQRAITLPSPVSSDNAEARIEQGILSLRLPKLQGAQSARRISVATGSSTSSASIGGSSTSSASPGGSSSTSSTGSGSTSTGASSTSPAPHGSRDHTAEGDKVTEESQESFPASDPPSWTPEKVG